MVPPQRPGNTSSGEPEEQERVRQLCALLGLGVPVEVERLSAGGSGALVVALTIGDDRMVLKVTSDPARLVRARRELRLVSEARPGLDAHLPRFIAGCDDGDCVCLVTREYVRLSHPAMVNSTQWCAIATALGGLHDAEVPSWLPAPVATPPGTAATVLDRCRTWEQYGVGDTARRAAEILRTADSAAGTLSLGGILHGDCHVDNVVHDEDGSLRWIDWQEVRRGNGLADLAFLWHRAEFGGANPPREAMMDAYRMARRLPDSDRWRRELQLAELRILLISWPPFLSYGSATARARMVDRLAVLVATLRTG